MSPYVPRVWPRRVRNLGQLRLKHVLNQLLFGPKYQIVNYRLKISLSFFDDLGYYDGSLLQSLCRFSFVFDIFRRTIKFHLIIRISNSRLLNPTIFGNPFINRRVLY